MDLGAASWKLSITGPSSSISDASVPVAPKARRRRSVLSSSHVPTLLNGCSTICEERKLSHGLAESKALFPNCKFSIGTCNLHESTNIHRSRFNFAVLKLEQAAASRSPARIFGPETPFILASTLGLPRQYNPAKQINCALERLVRDADRLIKEAFLPSDSSPDDGRKARAHCDAHLSGYFTYMEVPPLTPWEVETCGAESVFDTSAYESLQDAGDGCTENSFHDSPPAVDGGYAMDKHIEQMPATDPTIEPVDLTRASKEWIDFLVEFYGGERDDEEETEGRSTVGGTGASEDASEDDQDQDNDLLVFSDAESGEAEKTTPEDW